MENFLEPIDLDIQVKASGYKAKLNREDKNLQGAVASMSKEENMGNEEEEVQSEEEEEKVEEEKEEESEDEGEKKQQTENENENEKIIEALSSGRALKMDKFGNYILPEDEDL